MFWSVTTAEEPWISAFPKRKGKRSWFWNVRELDDGLSLRGSSNQNVCLMTGRYAKVAGKYYGQSRRKVELHLLKNEIFLAGIPGPEMLEKWKERQLL